VATRQTSSSGRPKSPRIQVVLPEDLCRRLTALADADSRTVSNMAKVLIQQGVERLERQQGAGAAAEPAPASPASPASAPTPAAAPSVVFPPVVASASPPPAPLSPAPPLGTEQFRAELERQGQGRAQRLRGAPRRVRLQRPPA